MSKCRKESIARNSTRINRLAIRLTKLEIAFRALEVRVTPRRLIREIECDYVDKMKEILDRLEDTASAKHQSWLRKYSDSIGVIECNQKHIYVRLANLERRLGGCSSNQ